MKNLLIILSAAVLLTSCGGSGFLNRKYTKGIYHGGISKASKPKSHNNTELAKAPALTITEKQLELAPTKEVEVNKETKPSTVAVAAIKTNKKANQFSSVLVDQFKPRSIATIITKAKQERILTEAVNKNGSSSQSDVKLIILVILAIFLPPLACYLKEKTTNTWFWVTLILCLLVFSYWFFHLGGLAWLIAEIIAILYIFDAIN